MGKLVGAVLGRECADEGGMRRWILRSVLVGFAFGLAVRPMSGQSSLGDVRMALFGGPAFQTAAVARPFELGVSGEASLFRAGRGRVGAGVLAEGGVYHPAISGKGNYYYSADALLDRMLPVGEAAPVRLFGVAGYTRFFNATDSAVETADAANFGLGMDRVLRGDLWLRLEVRENYTPASGSPALVLRIGIVAMGSLQ